MPFARRPWLLLALYAALATDQAFAQDPPRPAGEGPSVSGQSPKRPPPARVTTAAKVEATPTWRELTPPQQRALAPLAGSWSTLTEAHKRKWLALSANYPNMPPPEQARLHSRMGEWAALSPQQRTQARLNFAESKAVPADDKRAKWEAYQALPPEEKRKLAAGARAAKPPAPPTAAAVQPEQKLAKPPRQVPAPATPNARTPRIAGGPGQANTNTNTNTSLPRPGAAPLKP